MKVLFAHHLHINGNDWQDAVEVASYAINSANKIMRYEGQIELTEGACSFLKELSYSGKKIGVITADTKENAENHLKKAGIIKWIDFIIGSNCVKRSKPFPDMLDLAEMKYGVRMKEAIYFGDSRVDVRMAKLKCLNKIISVNNTKLNTDYHIKNFQNIYVEKGK